MPNQPVFLNLDHIFYLFYSATAGFFRYFLTWGFFGLLQIIATLVVIGLITLIIFLIVRIYEIKKEDKQKAKEEKVSVKVVTPDGVVAPTRNEQWEHIRVRALSDNPSEWRLAIIEADIYLDRVLDSQGFYGETLGDKLKKITETRLPSVQLAWAAHKVRNDIAHIGAEFVLTMPETRRIISYYEIVFRELGVIE